MKQELGWSDSEDGLFWMPFDKYLSGYANTVVCMESDSDKYIHTIATHDFNTAKGVLHRPAYFSITVDR